MKLISIIIQLTQCSSFQERAFENLELARYCKVNKDDKYDFCKDHKLEEAENFRLIFRPHRFHRHHPICYNCNRHSFEVDAQELVDRILGHTRKNFALYKIEETKVSPNEIIDIGYCNGSCKL